MLLDTTTRKLQLVLTAAMTTANMPVSVYYVDLSASALPVAGLTPTNSNGVTYVDILAAPAASTQRKVNALTVTNTDTAAKTVQIYLDDNTTDYLLCAATLQVGDVLGYTDTRGWYVNDSAGNLKVTPTNAIAASLVTNTPAGNIASTNQQAVNNELDSEKMAIATYDADADGVVDQAETVVMLCRNTTGVTISKMAVVYISGASGQNPTIALAKADAEATSSKTIGVVTADITNNSTGFVALLGELHDYDTSAFADGNTLWLSATVAGGMTATRPTAPNHAVLIGFVAYSHANNGKIALNVTNGQEMDELHDVLITSIADNQVLQYDSASVTWKNRSTLAGLTLTNPTLNAGSGVLVLPQSASPAQTAEGSMVWDTDDNLLTVGDGASRKTMVDLTATQSITGVKTFTGALASAQLAAGTNTLALADSKFVNNAIAEVSNPQAYAQGVALTAATSGSTGITTPDDANLDMGTNDFTVHFVGSLPDFTPSATTILTRKYSSPTGFDLFLYTDDKLYLTINTTNYVSTVVTTGLTDNRTAKITAVVIRETSTAAGSVTFYVNGYAFGSPVTITAGSPPSISNSAPLYICGTASTRTASTANAVAIFNRALTAAQVLSLSLNDVAEADKDGSQSNMALGDNATFATVGNWAGVNGTVTGGYDSGDAGHSTCLRYVATSAGSNRVELPLANCNFTLGKKYRVTFDIKRVVDTNNQTGFMSVFGTSVVAIPDAVGWSTISVEFTVSGTSAQLRIYGMSNAEINDEFLIDSFSSYPIGTVARYESENIQLDKWYDASSNGLHASYPSTGFSFVRPVIDNNMSGAQTDLAGSATLTIAQLLTKYITDTHVTGATATYTLPTATLMDAALPTFGIGKYFDWTFTNLSAAAADTATIAAGASHTTVGNLVIQSAHATTGALYGNSAVFRTKKTAASTYVTSRIS